MPPAMSNEYESYFKAGKALGEILRDETKKLRPGEELLRICERIESKIMDMGCFPAFPVNIGIDSVAAHYTSPPGDKSRIPEASLVKLDAGLRLDGYIVDAARTIVFDRKLKGLEEAASAALEAARKKMRPGVPLRDVGAVICDEVRKRGYEPIANLSGHKIEYFRLHAGIEVPNVPTKVGYKLKAGDIFAVEPFLTTREGTGLARPSRECFIFSYKGRGWRVDPSSRRILEIADKEYRRLPFAERWLLKVMGHRVISQLDTLVKRRALHSYPVLVEAKGELVAQKEDTFLITRDGAVPLTSP